MDKLIPFTLLCLLLIGCVNCNYLNKPFDWNFDISNIKQMQVSNGRVAAIANNNFLIGFDIEYVRLQNSTSAKVNFVMNTVNTSIAAATSDYALYSFEITNGFMIHVYNNLWDVQFSKEYRDCEMINFDAGEYYIGDDAYATFAVIYQNESEKIIDIYEEYPEGIFSLKQRLIDINFGEYLSVNENLLVVSFTNPNLSDTSFARFYWKNYKNDETHYYQKVSEEEYGKKKIRKIQVKNERVLIGVSTYSHLYKYNRYLGGITDKVDVNLAIQDMSFYDRYNSGFLTYIDDLKIPNLCTWDSINNDCSQLVTFYPVTYDPNTLTTFDKSTGNLVTSMQKNFYFALACSPNSVRTTSSDGQLVCSDCTPGTMNSGYATECYPCTFSPPTWTIYGPNPGCNYQCFFGKSSGSDTCIPMGESMIFYSVLASSLTIILSVTLFPFVFLFCGTFKLFVYVIGFLSFGLFATIPNFSWHFFDFFMYRKYNVSIYDAHVLRLIMLGIPSAITLILLVVYFCLSQRSRRSLNPNYFRNKKYPLSRIITVMSVGVIVACVPGFVVYLLDYIQIGIEIFNISLLHQAVFWYAVPLFLAVLSFFFSLCFWSCHRDKDIDDELEEIKRQNMSVNSVTIIDSSPLLLSIDQDYYIDKNLCELCRGNGKIKISVTEYEICNDCNGSGFNKY